MNDSVVTLQGKGIGILLLESGIQNKGAHEFFEKNGFTQVSVEYAKRLETSTILTRQEDRLAARGTP